MAAHAQGLPQTETPSAERQPFSIEPYVSIKETYTDNNRLASNDNEAELITQASAGVNMRANLARLRGFINYRLTGVNYARGTADDELQNALNAYATGELIDNLAFVDIGASISQQSVSVFGTQSSDPALDNSNRTEVSTLSVSPYVRGVVAGLADYEARLSYSGTKSDAAAVSDVANTSALLRLQREAAFGPLGWSLELSRRNIDYSAGREMEEDRLQAEAQWAVRHDLALTAIAGREANDFVTFNKQAHDIWGARARWKPTPRTDLLVEQQRRFFGNGHVVNLNHRTPRTVWAYVDTRDVQTSQNQPVLGSLGTAFDLLFRQFESLLPDPVLRQMAVLDFLQRNNIDPSTQIVSSFLTSGVTLQRQQHLSFAWQGIRDTVVVTATRSDSRRLDRVTSAVDDFTNADRIKQRGVSVTVTHRLTPLSSVAVLGLYREAEGSTAALATTLTSITAQWSTSLTSQADVSAGARHAVFDSPTSPYDETAVFVSLLWRF